MAYEADRVVVELIAKVDNFDAKVTQSAKTFDASADRVEKGAMRMTAAQFKAAGGIDGLAASFQKAAASSTALVAAQDKIAAGAQRSERSVRAMQQATRNLGYQISDIGTQVSMGTSPFIILAQQGPQVANALDGAKGKLGVFASFLSGPWGAALLGAITVLGVFITRHKDASDSVSDLVEKLKEQADKAESTRRAQAIFGETLEGVTKALDDNGEALKRLNDQGRTAELIALRNAIAAKMRLEIIRDETMALIDQARAQLEVTRAQASVSGSMRDSGAAAEQKFVEDRLDALQRRVKATSDQILRSQQQIQEASSRVAVQAAERMADPLESIKVKYEGPRGLIELARQRAVREGKTSDEIARQTALLKQQQRIEEEALKARSQRSSGLGGVQVSFAQAAAIARAAGLQVNSAQRSTAEQARLFNDPRVNRPGNPVAAPGTSAHEGVRGRWALDIQFAAGLTPQKIRKVFGDEGVSLSVVKKEAGHFHIEGSRSQAASQEREAARIAAREQERVRGFINERASLEGQVIDARQALVSSAEEVADFERQAVEAARQKYEQNIKALEEQGRLLPKEAKELIALNDERAKLRLEVVKRREQQALFAQQEARNENALAVQAGLLDAQKEVLQAEEGLARTSAERKRIEDRLIDLQFEEEKMRLQAQISLAARLRAEAERTKSAQDLAIAERAEADAAIARARLATLPARQAAAHTENAQANASPIQDYLNSIPQKAAEIDQALEAIAANGLESFTDGLVEALVNFKSLGDVARSVLQQITAMLLKMVIQQLILKAFGSFLGKADGGPIGKAAGGRIGHFAPGGYIAGAGGPTSDDVPIMASAGEYMIKTRSAKKVGYSTLEFINRTGELPERFARGGRINAVSPTNLALSGGRGGGFSQGDIQALRSIVAEASRAMPDVSLYASLDPAEMLQRALGAPAGHRALLAHMGSNSNAFSGAINRR